MDTDYGLNGPSTEFTRPSKHNPLGQEIEGLPRLMGLNDNIEDSISRLNEFLSRYHGGIEKESAEKAAPRPSGYGAEIDRMSLLATRLANAVVELTRIG